MLGDDCLFNTFGIQRNYNSTIMKYKLSLLAIVILTVMNTALKPEKKYEVTPAEFGLQYRDVTIETKDGLKLKGWFFQPAKKSGTVIVLSHDGDGNMSTMIEIASYFITAGYNVMTYDYRGFGESDNFSISTKFVVYPQFAKDLDAAIDFAHKTYGITQVILYGKGMGAALSIGAGSGRRDVQKVIADSPWDELNNYQKMMKEIKGEDVMIPLAYDKQLIDPRYSLAGKFAKTGQYLLINGSEDQIFTTKIMKSLAKINSGNVQVNTIKKADYSTTFSTDKTAYFDAISAFLN